MTVRLYLRKDQPIGDKFPIYLRVTFNRRAAKMTTGICVKENQWNSSSESVRKNHPSMKALNSRLEDFKHHAHKAIALLGQNGKVAPQDVIQFMKRSSQVDFFSLAKDIFEGQKGSYHTSKQRKMALRNFKEFAQREELPFSSISTSYLQAFIEFLSEDKNLASATVRKQVQPIKVVLNRAVKDRHLSTNPWEGIKLPKNVKVRPKVKLSYEHIKSMEALTLDPNKKIFHVRNAFLFSFYSMGLRWGDVCSMKWDDIENDVLSIVNRKTLKDFSVTLNDFQKNILSHYSHKTNGFIFPFLNDDKDYSNPRDLEKAISSQNAFANQKLKEISSLAGIDLNISTHVARHSWADIATKYVDLVDVRQSLNHSNIQTTQDYIEDLTTHRRDKVASKVYGSLE